MSCRSSDTLLGLWFCAQTGIRAVQPEHLEHHPRHEEPVGELHTREGDRAVQSARAREHVHQRAGDDDEVVHDERRLDGARVLAPLAEEDAVLPRDGERKVAQRDADGRVPGGV